MKTMDNSGSTLGVGGATTDLGLFPTKGDDVVKQLEQSLDEQRKRRKVGDAPSQQSMQLMPPATRDLLGTGTNYGMGR